MTGHRPSLSEFTIIDRFFRHGTGPVLSGSDTLGVGDDCALLSVPADQRLALSIDTMVEGRHFPADAPPADIAYRAVVAAASDLAAMGASPLAATLALTLPAVDEDWLSAFAGGLDAALVDCRLPLVGGDTTRGPLTVTVQAHGLVPADGALLRSGARAGDRVFVSGNLGDAAAALAVFGGSWNTTPEHRVYLEKRFYRPTPRLALGRALLPVASSAIDISDGLLADLGHIAAASDVAAVLDVDRLPLSPALAGYPERAQALDWALGGGDDYELCFTVPESRIETVTTVARDCRVALTEVGRIATGQGVQCRDARGDPVTPAVPGYQHFSDD